MQPIVKQPIHDRNGNVWAYEILYSSNAQWSDRTSDAEAANAIEALLFQCNSEEFLENRLAFVTFTQNLLLRNVPSIFSPDKLIIQLDQDFLLSPSAMELLEGFHEQGYKVALVGFEFNSLYLSVMNLVDYVKLSFKNPSNAQFLDSAAQVVTKLGKKVVAYNVNTEESYQLAKRLGANYMQGIYIAAAMPSAIQSVEHLPSNFFELMVAALKEEPDTEEIERIIARDVTLTYSLLRLVNSAFFSLRSKVKSVRQALAILGVGQLKQWIYLLSFKNDGNVPREFIKLSLMRANFCESLHPFVQGLPISAGEAYLMGMFSTLGVLLQRPLEDALRDIAIADEVKEALLFQSGRCGTLYKLMLCYETADWHMIASYADELGVPTNVLSQKYFECMDNVNDLWKRLSKDI